MSTSSWAEEDEGFERVGGSRHDSEHHDDHHESQGGHSEAFRDHGSREGGYGERSGGYRGRGGRGGGRGGSGGRGGGGFRQYGDRPPRQQNPLPTEPPYTAFVGNLPPNVIEGDFATIFDQLKIKQTRLGMDRNTGEFKGHAFVEFETLDDLRSAIDMNGVDVEGHRLRINVSTPREGGAHRGGRGGFDRRGGHDGGHGHREGGYREGGHREGGYREGGHREGGHREGGHREGGHREGGFREGGSSSREGGFREGRGGFRDRDSSRGSGYGRGYGGDRPPRSETPPADFPSSGASGPPKIKLAPRTVSEPVGAAAAPAASGRADPFAGAKPRDEKAVAKK